MMDLVFSSSSSFMEVGRLSALFSPVSEMLRGLKAYGQGVSWLKSHPRYLFLLFLPMMVALGLFAYGWDMFMGYEDTVFNWILFDKPASNWLLPLYYICKLFLYIAFFMLGVVACVLLSNIFACPIYELVSVAIEKDISQGRVEDIGFLASLKLIGTEIKKVVFILGVSILLLFIPGLNVISTFITAFLIGWDYYDYPLARRGWTFGRRLRFVMSDFWAVMGFGLWLMIPFVQVFLIPMAVAGGTMLNLNTVKRRQLAAADL